MDWGRLVSFALDVWERLRPSAKVDEPVASQRDIAIGVASSETARQEGKRAPELTKVIQRRGRNPEDTWPGELP